MLAKRMITLTTIAHVIVVTQSKVSDLVIINKKHNVGARSKVCKHFLNQDTGSVLCGLRKGGALKWSEYIDRNNKVAILMHP